MIKETEKMGLLQSVGDVFYTFQIRVEVLNEVGNVNLAEKKNLKEGGRGEKT